MTAALASSSQFSPVQSPWASQTANTTHIARTNSGKMMRPNGPFTTFAPQVGEEVLLRTRRGVHVRHGSTEPLDLIGGQRDLGRRAVLLDVGDLAGAGDR